MFETSKYVSQVAGCCGNVMKLPGWWRVEGLCWILIWPAIHETSRSDYSYVTMASKTMIVLKESRDETKRGGTQGGILEEEWSRQAYQIVYQKRSLYQKVGIQVEQPKIHSLSQLASQSCLKPLKRRAMARGAQPTPQPQPQKPKPSTTSSKWTQTLGTLRFLPHHTYPQANRSLLANISSKTLVSPAQSSKKPSQTLRHVPRSRPQNRKPNNPHPLRPPKMHSRRNGPAHGRWTHKTCTKNTATEEVESHIRRRDRTWEAAVFRRVYFQYAVSDFEPAGVQVVWTFADSGLVCLCFRGSLLWGFLRDQEISCIRGSVWMRRCGRGDHVMKVGRTNFSPPPLVESSVVRITPIVPRPAIAFEEWGGLSKVGFVRKNKTFRSSFFGTTSVMDMLEEL